jgi:hypothetical protein
MNSFRFSVFGFRQKTPWKNTTYSLFFHTRGVLARFAAGEDEAKRNYGERLKGGQKARHYKGNKFVDAPEPQARAAVSRPGGAPPAISQQ